MPSHNPIRLAEFLAAFSLATDLGAGRSMGHAARACVIGMQMAGELAAIGDAALRDDTVLLDPLDWLRKYIAPDVPLPNRALTIIGMLLHPRAAGEHLRGACKVPFRWRSGLECRQASRRLFATISSVGMGKDLMAWQAAQSR